MATYLILNCLFVVAAAALTIITGNTSLFRHRSWWISLGIMLVLTAIFDNILIVADIVAYDTSKLLGIYIGVAPVEDFFYTLLAVILVPTLWRILKNTSAHTEKETDHAHND